MHALEHPDGVVIGGFTDHHVHLQLVDAFLLAESRLGRVVDLGGDVDVLRPYVREGRFVSSLRSSLNDRDTAPRPLSERSETKRGEERETSIELDRDTAPRPLSERSETKRGEKRMTSVEFAGAFLTPVGGYPSDRSWAPTGSFREIATPADAVAAVAEMADAGASRIKVASNSTAGPVFDDDLFRAIVAAASGHGLPVVAHAEGAGQAQRAARLGAASLAHSPFTERLTDDEIAEQAASVSWISTLSIHSGADRDVAIDNVRRFHAAGGVVLYGTDMGNGPTPVDLNPLELDALREAGIDGADLLRALASQDPSDPASVLLLLPSPDSAPEDARLLKV